MSASGHTGSLRVRLLTVAAISIAIALTVTGFALVRLFTVYVNDGVDRKLINDLTQLTGNMSVDEDGAITVKPLANTRFSHPLSGLYWQIRLDNGRIAASRSLWDGELKFAAGDDHNGEFHRFTATGPLDETLEGVWWQVKVRPGKKERTATLAVAVDNAEVAAAVDKFARHLRYWLGFLGVVLILAAWAQVSFGLKPLEQVRQRIAEINSGSRDRLEGEFPVEVTPLVDAINALLERQGNSLRQARHRAGNLAHGLKTPLTILAAVARGLRKTSRDDAAAEIEEQIVVMRQHTERELMRARLAVDQAAMCDTAPLVHRLVGAMRKLPDGDEINWILNIDGAATAPMEGEDMSELLGNLLDNARKYAQETVRIEMANGERSWRLSVEDDGPGVGSADLEVISERGRRLDETRQGSGLGLAIVADITEAYGGDLKMSRSSRLGGLRVEVAVPVRNVH